MFTAVKTQFILFYGTHQACFVIIILVFLFLFLQINILYMIMEKMDSSQGADGEQVKIQ